MSRVAEHRFFPVTADQLIAAAAQTSAQMGYKVRRPSPAELVATQSFWSSVMEGPVPLLVMGLPAKVTVSVTSAPGGANAACVVSNFGFDPVQTGHVKKHMERFLRALEKAVSSTPAPAQPAPREADEVYCSRCGRVIKADSRLCPHCGGNAGG